ncbi:MAG TPA: hypothetical protein DCZ72_15145 [Armatimonadetes bacterium]|nr:hypothetical protein [Armatimonadota bacterium]
MNTPAEMISEAQVERLMLTLLWLGPLLGLAGGLVWAAARRVALAMGARLGLWVGLLGPLVWVLWRVFAWLTRFRPGATPDADYFGLERVDVLLGLVVLFIVVGAGVGWLSRRVWAGVLGAEDTAAAGAKPDE